MTEIAYHRGVGSAKWSMLYATGTVPRHADPLLDRNLDIRGISMGDAVDLANGFLASGANRTTVDGAAPIDRQALSRLYGRLRVAKMMQESHFVSDGEAGERAYGLFRRAFEFPWPPNLSIDNPGLDPELDRHWLSAYNRFRELYQGRENGTLSRAEFNRQIREFSDNLMRDPNSPLNQGITVATLPSNIAVWDGTQRPSPPPTITAQAPQDRVPPTSPRLPPTSTAQPFVVSQTDPTVTTAPTLDTRSRALVNDLLENIHGMPPQTAGYQEHLAVIGRVFAERNVNIITIDETLPQGSTPVGDAFVLSDIIPAVSDYGNVTVNNDHWLYTDTGAGGALVNEFGAPITRENSGSDTETALMRAFEQFYRQNPGGIIDRSSAIPARNIEIQMYQGPDGERIAIVTPLSRAEVVSRADDIVYNNDTAPRRR
ncbi:MAG: hypothetical protein J0M34_00795 [Alphaproteobacteria bacterium]|nr:hypothetical protein [Alphaproteobacteria bacterium]